MHDHDRGLQFDLRTLRSRRAALALFGGAGLAALAACGPGTEAATPSSTATSAGSTTTGASAAAGQVAEIPEETAGPFPGDGSNGPNVLTESGIVRSDIRSSFGSARGTAAGVPLRIELTVVEAGSGAVAARPLRGLPEARRRHVGRHEGRHLAARAPPGRLRDGVRHRRVRAEHPATSSRPRWSATWCSATAGTPSSPRSPVTRRRATWRR